MHVLDVFLNHHRSKKKKFHVPIQIKFKYNSNFDWNSNSNYANIQLSTTLFRENSIIFILLYIRYERGNGSQIWRGRTILHRNSTVLNERRKWIYDEEKKCNIDWILESEGMQNQRAHINSFDLLNRLIWMFKFQARSTQFARTLRLFNSFPSTIQTVLASTTTKPDQLAC